MEHQHSSEPTQDSDIAPGGDPAVPPASSKRLHRSNDQRILLGVCGGLAEHFEIDPTLVRAAFVLLAVFGGGGILLYVVLAFVMPAEGMLESHPRDAARATVDEAVDEAKRAVTRGTDWVQQKVSRVTSSRGGAGTHPPEQ